MAGLLIGMQVYSIRQEAGSDFSKAMGEVKAMGYDGVELAGLYGHKPESIRDCLKEIGLIPIAAHVPYEELMNDLKTTVSTYATVGCRYIAIPYLAENKRYGTKEYDTFLEDIPMISEECKKYGIVLMYHNHDFEFEKTEEGKYVLDDLYDRYSSDVLQTEIDTCWVKAANVDPIDYVKKYKNRSPLLHLKDYTGNLPVEYTTLGRGVQDIKGLMVAAEEVGVKWVIVEQDEHPVNDAMTNMKRSLEYLKEIGY